MAGIAKRSLMVVYTLQMKDKDTNLLFLVIWMNNFPKLPMEHFQ